ncbi:hypothetical protein DL768_009988 [Monosporascus sp. mg162]|nr:hypothetical protein DL768_009988 [Monosporascus sp. mg162]
MVIACTLSGGGDEDGKPTPGKASPGGKSTRPERGTVYASPGSMWMGGNGGMNPISDRLPNVVCGPGQLPGTKPIHGEHAAATVRERGHLELVLVGGRSFSVQFASVRDARMPNVKRDEMSSGVKATESERRMPFSIGSLRLG